MTNKKYEIVILNKDNKEVKIIDVDKKEAHFRSSRIAERYALDIGLFHFTVRKKRGD